MAQEYKPGEIVPPCGIYTITLDPAHADMPDEVTVIKGRRFPTCRHCKGIRFGSRMRRGMSAKSTISRRRMRRPGNRFMPPPWRAP